MKALSFCIVIMVLLFGTVANADVFGLYDRHPTSKNKLTGMTVGQQGDDYIIMGSLWVSERLHIEDFQRYYGAASIDGNWAVFDWENQFCKNPNSRLRITFGAGVGGRATLKLDIKKYNVIGNNIRWPDPEMEAWTYMQVFGAVRFGPVLFMIRDIIQEERNYFVLSVGGVW